MLKSDTQQSFFNSKAADVGALALVVALMILSWFLVSGVATAVYDQYAAFGDPPKTMGPAGGTARSQQGHNAYFWSERAFHYRTTLMFALDDFDDTASLARDTLQQYPDGVDAWAEYTILMEPVYGQLYRWFGRSGETLVEFLLRLIPLVHVLLFLPIFFLARSLGVKPWLAFLGVLIYASCALGYTRLAGSLLLKENFSMLWLMIFLAAHHQACSRKNLLSLLVAAAALILALASWHLSQFLVLVVFLAAGLTGSGNSETSRGYWPGPWWPALVYLGSGILAGFTPSLFSRGFFLSLPMAALAAWLVSTWWAQRNGSSESRRLLVWFVVLLLLGAVSVFNPLVEGDYNHVSGLLLHKIANGFVRPDDPSGLPFDVRVFWAPPFTSVNFSGAFAGLGYHLFLLGAAAVLLAFSAVRKRLNKVSAGFLLTALAYFLAWILIERLGIVFWPVGVVAVVLAAQYLMEKDFLRKTGKASLVVALVLLLTPVLNFAGPMKDQIKMARRVHSGQSVRMSTSDGGTAPFKVELFDWLRRETTGVGSPFPGKVAGGVLGEVGVSTQVLLYARRPVVLNSQFENTPIRQRYRRYLELLFGSDEQAFARFLAETQTAYLFINRNWATSEGPGSVSWQAGVEQDLSLDMVMLRLHFRPESFSFLQPVFDNEFYRVFRVGARPVKNLQGTAWDSRYNPIWDENSFNFSNGNLTDPAQDREILSAAENQWNDLQGKMQLILDPQLMQLTQQRLQLIFQSVAGGAAPDSLKTAEFDLRIAQLLNRISQRGGQSSAARLKELLTGTQNSGMLKLLENDPAGPVNYASAGQLLGMLQQYEQAADTLEKAAAFFPLRGTCRGRDGKAVPAATAMASRIRQECIWWNIGAGRYDHAAQLASRFIQFEQPGSRQRITYQALIDGVHKLRTR